jgi:uroporphyrin-III C-methyltransferase
VKGKIYLVGAGPGDPELLTLKALRLIREADVILHDDLVSAEILDSAPRTSHIRNIGKRCGQRSTSQSEINSLLIAFASLGLKVVRLKGGDPLVFGRAGEEMAALRRAGIEFEVVPGVTSALSAAASIQVSLTHRDLASTLVFLPGHHAEDSSIDLRALAASRATFVIYMPGHDYRDITYRLLAAELRPDTPCAIVSHVMASDEQVHIATIDTLSESPRLPAPSILIVGEVVRQARTNIAADALSLEASPAPPALYEPANAFTQAEQTGSLTR